MSNRPPFLDALTDDAILTPTVLRDHVAGTDAITKVIETAGTFYASLDRTFHEQVKNKEFMEYDAVLTGGHKLHGLITLTKTADGKVSHISVTHSPIETVIWLSKEMGKKLSRDLGPDAFL
jgi:hypothetical protein